MNKALEDEGGLNLNLNLGVAICSSTMAIYSHNS